MDGRRIAVIRLGAMGDIIHALPAVASLKYSFPHSYLAWIIDRKWTALLESNPFVDEVIAVDSSSLPGVLQARKQVGSRRYDFAVDFQGLTKSAAIASRSRADRIYGFHYRDLREKIAGLFYSHPIKPAASHMVDRCLDLAAGAGATSIVRSFPLPLGRPEDRLPEDPFVLACPLAGWPAKQWPLEYYQKLGESLLRDTGLRLVLNGPPESGFPHITGIPGLIDATRRAVAVVGTDSGPLHLAAALGKPGVAIYGPTDPARNGPYAGTIDVLRDPAAVTSYKRRRAIDPSMWNITPEMVLERLKSQLLCRARVADSSS